MSFINKMMRLKPLFIVSVAMAADLNSVPDVRAPLTPEGVTAEFDHVKSWRGNPKDWKISATLPQDEYVIGEAWPLKVTMINASPSRQWLVYSRPREDFYITLLDQNGWRVPMKLDYFDAKYLSYQTTKNTQKQLASGGKMEWDVNLAECFDLEKAGTYLLRIERFLGIEPTQKARFGDRSGPKVASEQIKLVITAKRIKPKPLPPERIPGPRLKVP